MKRNLLSLIFIFSITSIVFSQNEANNWFFGYGAGLDFSSGTPVPVSGSLNTLEGCASISDSSGQLLFYTDGITVYGSDNQVMLNGNNLHGSDSSSQSAIIVPKPLSTTEYYVFTVDEHNTNLYGLQYSLVDMNANGGLGEVVLAEKNVPLLEHATEKITAVKSANCDSIWVIAFSSANGINRIYDTFHSFEVTSTGINNSIISTLPTSTSDGRGYLKVSADGTKVAIAHTGMGSNGVKLYDFNSVNGNITNEQSIILSDISHANNNTNTYPYGLEFSLDSSKLYVTSFDDNGSFNQPPSDGYLWQVDIANATLPTALISFNSGDVYRGALQMGPDGKIYRAINQYYGQGSSFLGAINNPNDLGLTCNYVHNAITLAQGTFSQQGLPPFIQSLFIADLPIVIEAGIVLDVNLDLCDGETFLLEPDISTFPVGTTYSWTKDDLPLTITSPSLTVDNATAFNSGHYRLSVDYNDGSCPKIGEAFVEFHLNPIINSPITIKQCDDDTDGFSLLDLTNYEDQIRTDLTLTETVTFYNTQTAAETQDISELINATNFNTNNTTIYARVENNYGCDTIGVVNIEVTTSTTNYTKQFYECDDLLDIDGNDTTNNDNTDGVSGFDFSSVTNEVIHLFPTAQQPNLEVAFYANIQDGLLEQNPILNSNDFRNINAPNYQKIYIKVTNSQNADCVGFGENMTVELFVEEIPIAHAVPPLRVCADNINGTFPVDTSTLESDILQGQTNVAVTYFDENDVEIFPTQNPTYNTVTQTIKAVVTKTNSQDPDGQCTAETFIDFIVDAQPFIIDTPTFEPACDDGVDDTDLMANFDTSLVEYTIKGGHFSQDEMAYRYFNEDGTQIFNEDGLENPLPDPFYTGTQTVTVEMYNPVNTTCVATTTLDFEVYPLPEFEVNGDLLCLNYLPNPVTIDIENAADVYQYYWYDKDGNDITVDNSQAFYNFTSGGDYSVKAVNNFNCERVRTFTIEESEQPTIEDVQVYDNQGSNRIAIIVSGISEYEFALDNSDYELGNTENGNLYLDVTEGLHTIKVRDVLGCGEVTYDVPVIRFPKFFTPNGDGINENWQVISNNAFPLISFTIFDRHGKIISQFTDKDTGWDGKYLGKEAHKTDYWYIAIITDRNGNQFERRGHFSLK